MLCCSALYREAKNPDSTEQLFTPLEIIKSEDITLRENPFSLNFNLLVSLTFDICNLKHYHENNLLDSPMSLPQQAGKNKLKDK